MIHMGAKFLSCTPTVDTRAFPKMEFFPLFWAARAETKNL